LENYQNGFSKRDSLSHPKVKMDNKIPTPDTNSNPDSEKVNSMVSRILSSRKYKNLEIPRETIIDLIQKSSEIKKDRDLEKAVRQKLHNIIAPYLENLDYDTALAELNAFNIGDESDIQKYCLRILSAHASTKERIPIMREFYAAIFQACGKPSSILDLACGLNPFALPWMDLPTQTVYHAYDLHQPRIDLINAFFSLLGRSPLAEKRDILVDPPKINADMAFFFKEAHRFEQRQHGCNRAFWQALNVNTLVVSLPAANLTGSHSMLEGQRILVERTIQGLPWKVHEILFDTEIVFCITK
jgi:16S rRNA (guanine(1405)-N(7))-methyltransferase